MTTTDTGGSTPPGPSPAAASPTPAPWRVELDGADLSGDYIAVEAMNIRFVGPKIPLAPDADPGDGLLDIALVGASEQAELLRYVGERLTDASGELPRLKTHRGRHLRLVAPPGTRMHAGDALFEPPRAGQGEKAAPPGPDSEFDILLKPALLRVFR